MVHLDNEIVGDVMRVKKPKHLVLVGKLVDRNEKQFELVLLNPFMWFVSVGSWGEIGGRVVWIHFGKWKLK